jgi:hypothetical protein
MLGVPALARSDGIGAGDLLLAPSALGRAATDVSAVR